MLTWLHLYTGRKVRSNRRGQWYNLRVKRENGIYNTDKLAKFFGVTERTVFEWCRKGKIPAFKIGKKWKVRVADLQKMIDRKVRGRKESSAPRLL